ncbi:hypothetical protein EZS27_011004 [termite gut metagenome]|uniref:Uncharacterized protein n=1 Tax=termite gut metagenome TaxID=433724 RepID=A0A5J4S6Y4_9ZZZZ
MIIERISVSMKNVLKLLFNFVVTALRTSLQIPVYWLSMLIILSMILIVVEYLKITEYQLLDQFYSVKLS